MSGLGSQYVKTLACAGLKACPIDSAVTEDITKLKAIAVASGSPQLLGAGEESKALVSQWLSFSVGALNEKKLSVLEKQLQTRSYLAGYAATLADYAVFISIAELSDSFSFEQYPSIGRWYRHVQNLAVENSNGGDIGVALKPFTVAPTLFPVPVVSTTAAASSEKVKVSGKDVPAATATATAGDAKKDSKKDGKKDVKKEDKKEGKSAAAPAAKADLDPSKLDIRVGQVVKCWNHPDSDKLLCEEIDLGEKTDDGKAVIRTIASGLRAHYTAEEVQGRKVVVLANLKERPMAGFKSQGMVLCAVGGDHSVVKLVEPPEGATIGDKISFPGFDGEPATPAQVAKKKILEGLAPQLRTDGSGVAHWDNSPFTVGGGVCKAPLPNAAVS